MGTMHPPEGQIRIPPSSAWKKRIPPPRRLRHALVIALATTVTTSACGFAARPARASDDLFGRDKALHFAASAGIALGGYGATALFTEDRRPRLLVGGGLALLAGIAKEVADRHTGGDPSWRDFGWDVLGTATGLSVAYGIDWLIERLRRPQGAAEPGRSVARLCGSGSCGISPGLAGQTRPAR